MHKSINKINFKMYKIIYKKQIIIIIINKEKV